MKELQVAWKAYAVKESLPEGDTRWDVFRATHMSLFWLTTTTYDSQGVIHYDRPAFVKLERLYHDCIPTPTMQEKPAISLLHPLCIVNIVRLHDSAKLRIKGKQVFGYSPVCRGTSHRLSSCVQLTFEPVRQTLALWSCWESRHDSVVPTSYLYSLNTDIDSHRLGRPSCE